MKKSKKLLIDQRRRFELKKRSGRRRKTGLRLFDFHTSLSMKMHNVIENDGSNRIGIKGITSPVVRKGKSKIPTLYEVGGYQKVAEKKGLSSREFEESYGDKNERHGRTLNWPVGRVQKHLHSSESALLQSSRRSTMAPKFRLAEDKLDSKINKEIVILEGGAEDDEVMSNGEGSSSSFESMDSHEKREMRKLLTGPKSQPRMTLERVRQILADVKAILTMRGDVTGAPRSCGKDNTEIAHVPSSGDDEELQCMIEPSSSLMPTKKVRTTGGKSKMKGNLLVMRGSDDENDYFSRGSNRKFGVQWEQEDISHGTQDRCTMSYDGRIENYNDHHNEDSEGFADQAGNDCEHLDNTIILSGDKSRTKIKRYCVRDRKGRYKKPFYGENGHQQDTIYGIAAKSDRKSSKDVTMGKEKQGTDALFSMTMAQSNYPVSLSHRAVSGDECLDKEYFDSNGKVIKKDVESKRRHKSRSGCQIGRIQDESVAIEQPITDALEFHAEKPRRRKKRKVNALEGDSVIPIIASHDRFPSGDLCPGSTSKVEDWDPPMSPFKLIQESFRGDPWKVMLSSMLLNKATGRGVDKIILDLFKICPDAQSAINTPTETIADIVYSLGLQNKRAKMIQRFSYEYQQGDWTNVAELHGIGKYATDSYAIFYQGLWREVVPDDPMLIKYWKWLNDLHGSAETGKCPIV